MFLSSVLFSTFKNFLSEYERKTSVSSAKPPLLSVFNSSLRPLRLSVQSKSSFATLCLCVQFLSLQAGFSFTPLPLEYDCAYLTLPMALNATTFDCDSGPACSITMTVRVSVLDSAQNEFYAFPTTFAHPCDLFPTLTYTYTWPPGWFVYNGLIPGATYWIQLEMLSFAASTSATETYLLGNNLKVQLEAPVTYSQPEILTIQSFVYSPMEADFTWQKPKQNKIKALTNATITLMDQSEIYGEVDYRWYLDGALIGTDSVIAYTAPCREHEIRLEIEQVPGGCVTEKSKMIPSFGGCVSPLREVKTPFLPGVIGRGERLELPQVAGRKYELIDLSGKALPLDTRRLSVGIYYLRVLEGRDFAIHKFLVQ